MISNNFRLKLLNHRPRPGSSSCTRRKRHRLAWGTRCCLSRLQSYSGCTRFLLTRELDRTLRLHCLSSGSKMSTLRKYPRPRRNASRRPQKGTWLGPGRLCRNFRWYRNTQCMMSMGRRHTTSNVRRRNQSERRRSSTNWSQDRNTRCTSRPMLSRSTASSCCFARRRAPPAAAPRRAARGTEGGRKP